MDIVIEAAMVGAGASLAAQALAFFVQSQLKHSDANRTDEGVRRQVVALVDQVGNYVFLARRFGPMDWQKMGEFLDRLQSRIYLWEVSTALSNEQSEALYYAAGMIEIAYNNAKQITPTTNEDESVDQVIAGFNDSCSALAQFWKTMGDATRSRAFAEISFVREMNRFPS